MLRNSDRLRILSARLGLSQEDFLIALAGIRNKKPAELRKTVDNWWHHKRDPKKDQEDVIAVLQQKVKKQKLKIDVDALWKDLDMTAPQFAHDCGTTIDNVLNEISDVCRRASFELLEGYAFLRQLRVMHRTNPDQSEQVLRPFAGGYQLFRIHSADRGICRELIFIDYQKHDPFCSGRYFQYAQGAAERPLIELTGFSLGPSWLQMVGTYVQPSAGGAIRNCMLHLVLVNQPYRGRYYAGLLIDIADNESAATAQRVLIKKMKKSETERFRSQRPVLFQEDKFDSDLLLYHKFLEIGPRDKFIIWADYARMSEAFQVQ